MDTKITKKIVEDYARSKGLSVKDFLNKYSLTTDSNYSRMIKTGTFKVQFLEKIADVIHISIDELIGRKPLKKIAKNDNPEFETIIQQKDEIISKLESTIKDKLKIISLLEKQIKYEEVR